AGVLQRHVPGDRRTVVHPRLAPAAAAQRLHQAADPAAVHWLATSGIAMAAGHAAADDRGCWRHRRLAPAGVRAHAAGRATGRGRRMSRIWHSLRQTLLAVLCDRHAIVVMVGAVILYSFFYPAAYRHQVAGNLPVLVVDEDHSATSRELLRKLDSLRVAHVVGQPADLQEARAQLEAGHAEGIVLIPANLERDILRGHPAKLVLLGNGAYLGRASWVLGS